MAKKKHEDIPCPCKGCSTFFSGTNLQIANNFKTHYHGAHVKINDNCVIDEAKKEKLLKDLSKEDYEEIINNFEEIMSNFEPEATVEDENKNRAKSKFNPNDVCYDLDHYISGKLVCREERQFALYFFNKLENLEKNSRIRIILENNPNGKPFLEKQDIIVKVFYEVAIMRDYWHVNKKSFNNLLFDYVTSPENGLLKESCIDEAIKKDNETHANGWKPSIYIARWMMNAKPDIGLIIKNNGNYRLAFIECKYLSGEDEYKHKDPKSNITEKMKQTKLQEHILKFICGKLKASYNNNPLKQGQVGLVKFIQDESKCAKIRNNDTSNVEIEIPLKYLLA